VQKDNTFLPQTKRCFDFAVVVSKTNWRWHVLNSIYIHKIQKVNLVNHWHFGHIFIWHQWLQDAIEHIIHLNHLCNYHSQVTLRSLLPLQEEAHEKNVFRICVSQFTQHNMFVYLVFNVTLTQMCHFVTGYPPTGKKNDPGRWGQSVTKQCTHSSYTISQRTHSKKHKLAYNNHTINNSGFTCLIITFMHSANTKHVPTLPAIIINTIRWIANNTLFIQEQVVIFNNNTIIF